MTFGQFLIKARQADFWESIRKLNFVIPDYSPLFFSAILTVLKAQLGRSVIVCDSATYERSDLEGALSISFLGNSSTYVIYAGAESNGKFDAQFVSFLKNYTGPHRVILFTGPEQALPESASEENSNAGCLRITVPESIDRATYSALYSFIRAGQACDPQFVQQLFGRAELGASATVPLERACVLIAYQAVMGKNHEQFFSNWFDKICEPKHSLFTLSQHLFAQDKVRFYTLWSQVKEDYAPEFWIAFFAEQLWQALAFVSAQQALGTQRAETRAGAGVLQGNRLPFSFAQRDWKRHSIPNLSQAFNLLYQFDFANKNGALTEGFDLVFAKLL